MLTEQSSGLSANLAQHARVKTACVEILVVPI